MDSPKTPTRKKHKRSRSRSRSKSRPRSPIKQGPKTFHLWESEYQDEDRSEYLKLGKVGDKLVYHPNNEMGSYTAVIRVNHNGNKYFETISSYDNLAGNTRSKRQRRSKKPRRSKRQRRSKRHRQSKRQRRPKKKYIRNKKYILKGGDKDKINAYVDTKFDEHQIINYLLHEVIEKLYSPKMNISAIKTIENYNNHGIERISLDGRGTMRTIEFKIINIGWYTLNNNEATLMVGFIYSVYIGNPHKQERSYGIMINLQKDQLFLDPSTLNDEIVKKILMEINTHLNIIIDKPPSDNINVNINISR